MELTLKKILLFVLCFFQIGCNQKEGYPEGRYFDYSGSDGCKPPNIGHMLGGDLEGFENNKIESMKHIASMQDSDCFKHWELDVTSASDGLVLMHDIWFGFNLTSNVKTSDLAVDSLQDFVAAFEQVNVTKPLMIDIKTVTNKNHLIELKAAAEKIQEKHNVDIWFITDQVSAFFMPEVCNVLGSDFDVMLYFKGGRLCSKIN